MRRRKPAAAPPPALARLTAESAGAWVLLYIGWQPDGDRRLVLACPSAGTASGLSFGFWGEERSQQHQSSAGPQRLDQPAAGGRLELRRCWPCCIGGGAGAADRRKARTGAALGGQITTVATMVGAPLHLHRSPAGPAHLHAPHHSRVLPAAAAVQLLIGSDLGQRRWLIQILPRLLHQH